MRKILCKASHFNEEFFSTLLDIDCAIRTAIFARNVVCSLSARHRAAHAMPWSCVRPERAVGWAWLGPLAHSFEFRRL